MAITFTQQKKKQKYLIIILAIIVLLTLIIVFSGLFFKPVEEEPFPAVTFKKVEIDFKTLSQADLINLVIFEDVLPFEGEVGRQNPFLPY
jgi:flagellar basal body-associated protein FliL